MSEGDIRIGGERTTAQALGIRTRLDGANESVAALPDLQRLLQRQRTVSQAGADIIGAAQTYSSNRAKEAERQKQQAEHDFRQAEAGARIKQAEQTKQDWGVGGSKNRALQAVTTVLTGSLGGQSGLQVASNTIAPYAATLIGDTFGQNGSHPNKAAQLLGHAILGAALAYSNGGDPAAGAASGAGAEGAAMVLTRTLYGEEAAKRPDLLPEQDKERIRTLSSAVAAVVGGVSGSRDGGGNAVDVLSNAQVGGVVGRNAVENNYYLTPVAASHSEQEAREIYRILKDQIDTTCGNRARINECRAYIGHIVNFLQNKELSDKYPDLTNQSKRFLANHSDLVESFIRGERQRLEARDKSAFFRYVIPGSQMVFGAVGVASSVAFGGVTCAESAGLGCAAAGVGIIANSDEITTGARNFGRRASEQQPTRIVQAFMATGMSRDSAETTSLLISLGATGGAGAAPKAGMLFNRSSNTARYATAGSTISSTSGRTRWGWMPKRSASSQGTSRQMSTIDGEMVGYRRTTIQQNMTSKRNSIEYVPQGTLRHK